MFRVTHPTARPIRTLLVAGIVLAAGCASAPDRREDPLVPSVSVRIEGLRFLSLSSTRDRVLDQMHRNGYVCFPEAATIRYVPCTYKDPHILHADVVLTFSGSSLEAVRAPLRLTSSHPQVKFEDLYLKWRGEYERAFVERGGDGALARFFPGDGSVIELRYVVASQSLDEVHRATRRAEPTRLAQHVPVSLSSSERN